MYSPRGPPRSRCAPGQDFKARPCWRSLGPARSHCIRARRRGCSRTSRPCRRITAGPARSRCSSRLLPAAAWSPYPAAAAYHPSGCLAPPRGDTAQLCAVARGRHLSGCVGLEARQRGKRRPCNVCCIPHSGVAPAIDSLRLYLCSILFATLCLRQRASRSVDQELVLYTRHSPPRPFLVLLPPVRRVPSKPAS